MLLLRAPAPLDPPVACGLLFHSPVIPGSPAAPHGPNEPCPPSSSRSFSAQKGSSMRPSMEKVLRVGKKYSALAPARTPTTWVMQWRMDCRAVVQVKSTFFLMFCAHPS